MFFRRPDRTSMKLPTALTFDDGPAGAVTLDLLNTLDSKGVMATFFLVGSRAANQREIVSLIASRGHEIGNHSWTHPNFAKLADGQFISELARVHDCIGEITGFAPKLLRPPYGVISKRQRMLAEQQFGYSTVAWNVDTLDWKLRDSRQIAASIRSSVNKGYIVLLHDLYPTTVEAVDVAISNSIDTSGEWVTVSSLRSLYAAKAQRNH